MPSLAVLALATPIFGFALTPPSAAPLAMPGGLSVAPFAQVDEAVPDGETPEATQPEAAPDATEAATPDAAETTATDAAADMAEPAAEAPAQAPSPEEAAASTQAHGENDLANVGEQLRQRQEIASVHRAFGIATWASMLVTEVLGLIQYNNLYGWFGSLEDTPCVQGTAVFGQDQCWGAPWPHLIAAMTTTALYATTFALSFAMPDPLGADEGDSAFANKLRIHETLRWIHLGGMIAQVLLGFAMGGNWFGLERANDFGAMQALATVHEIIGLGTFGVLTAAGAIMLF